MKALILCGGRGRRLQGNFGSTPKPLVSVQGKPLVAHLIDQLARYGLSEFVLLVGEDKHMFESFAESHSTAGKQIRVHPTGSDTPTGGRIFLARELLGEDSKVLVTYGDGVSDVDIGMLVARHMEYGGCITLTAVRPYLPYGLLEIGENGAITSFIEKPRMTQYTNGGFFIVEASVIEKLSVSSDFENHVLPEVAARGALGAFCHDGFWMSMDTYKDFLALSAAQLPDSFVDVSA